MQVDTLFLEFRGQRVRLDPVSLGDVAGHSWLLQTKRINQLWRLRQQLQMAEKLVAYAAELQQMEPQTYDLDGAIIDPAHPDRTTNPKPKEPDGP